jgi:hypothetical protein
MNVSGDPNDARFDQVESVLNQLSNSQRHLLTAQVLMNDRLSKTESILQRVAENLEKLTVKVDKLAEQMQIQADGQKHSDARIDSLRHLIERDGKHLQ